MEVQYFGHYDSGSGDYKAFYTSDIWPDSGSFDTPYIELSFDEWQEALSTRCRVVDGIHTPIPYTIEEETEGQWRMVRMKREALLGKSDWVVLPHSPITGSKLDEWIEYRQDLRDVTTQSNPFEISWPTKPE